ncbi:hypothetical protein ABZ671_16855 [Micromonospora sp. NPDC006766]|uniref:hypothetical protein n=1 Tax=Micromonospora sp. NPDC006766 TaxID=3154778 RepID=UPI0033FEA3BC
MVAVAVAAAAGLLGWHVRTPEGVMPAASPPETAHGSAPTLSVEHPPVEVMRRSTVTPGAGGTRTLVAGVPAGFARSQDGAAEAATAWLAMVEGGAALDASRRSSLLAAVGDPDFVRAAEARLAARALVLGLDPIGLSPRGTVMAVAQVDRGAYRVARFSVASAAVEVWYPYVLGVRGSGDGPIGVRWRRAAIELRWDSAAGDWRLPSDFGFADGPDPQGADPSQVDKADALADTGKEWLLYATAQD